MRISLLLLLFPFTLASQQLPDSAVAAKLGVKKLVVLRCEEGFPADTESVYVFDNGWKRPDGLTSLYETFGNTDTAYADIVRDEKGRIVFSRPKYLSKRYCYNDTVGVLYRYDEKGRIIYSKSFSCEKGDKHWFYQYDAAGRKIVKYNDPPSPIVLVTREENVYNADGQLLETISWWALHPASATRDSTDMLTYRLQYTYDANGLISEVKAFDPLHTQYCPMAWTSPTGEPRTPSDTVVFRYVYIYAD
jgi:hypothetical protein